MVEYSSQSEGCFIRLANNMKDKRYGNREKRSQRICERLRDGGGLGRDGAARADLMRRGKSGGRSARAPRLADPEKRRAPRRQAHEGGEERGRSGYAASAQNADFIYERSF